MQSCYADHVFPPETSNQEVFEVVAENVIYSTMEGYNGTSWLMCWMPDADECSRSRHYIRLWSDKLGQNLYDEGLIQEPRHDPTCHPRCFFLHQTGLFRVLWWQLRPELLIVRCRLPKENSCFEYRTLKFTTRSSTIFYALLTLILKCTKQRRYARYTGEY